MTDDSAMSQTVRMSRRPGVTVVLAVAMLAGTAACGADGPAAAPSATPTAKPSKDPLTSCVDQLVYWGTENLRGARGQEGDYQHMGLTADKYDALRKIQKDARVIMAKGKLPPTWLQEQSHAACQKIVATPKPSNTVGGWPQ
jgi:predicted small lipoprotein YifL